MPQIQPCADVVCFTNFRMIIIIIVIVIFNFMHMPCFFAFTSNFVSLLFTLYAFDFIKEFYDDEDYSRS